MINKLLAGLAIIAGFFALLFRGQNQKNKAQATQQKQRADIANADIKTQQKIDSRRKATEIKHKEERINEKAKLARGDRNHLDNDWN